MAAAMLLAGCANFAESTADEATPDIATPDIAALSTAIPDFDVLPIEASTEAPTEPPTEPPSLDELAQARYDAILDSEVSGYAIVDVDEMYQNPELPTGCESVALTIAINHFGYDLSKTDIADKYMEYGDSFVMTYYGNPYGEGAGIFPPGIVKTVWNFVEDTGAEIYPFDTSGCTIKKLYRFLDAGYPIVVWTTVYMEWPYLDGGEFYEEQFYPWYDYEHCVCMYGYDRDEDIIYISDPQRGNISVSAEAFEDIYDEIGRFSVALMDTSDLGR